MDDKTCYLLHYETLQTYLKYGLKLTKIHRDIKYDESDFLAGYIDSNTRSRTAATNEFEKDFFKLINNSVFGKTIENVRARTKIKIVNGQETKTLEKLIAKPYYRGSFIFKFEDSELVSVRMGESTVMLNKPIYLGQAILDISKTLMYKFHYEYIKPSQYIKSMKTEQGCCSRTRTHYAMRSRPRTFTRTYLLKTFPSGLTHPKDHPSEIPTGMNNKVLGMMKDEAGGKQITEFLGLRSQLYAFKAETSSDKKCKGVKKAVVKNHNLGSVQGLFARKQNI